MKYNILIIILFISTIQVNSESYIYKVCQLCCNTLAIICHGESGLVFGKIIEDFDNSDNILNYTIEFKNYISYYFIKIILIIKLLLKILYFLFFIL